MISKLSQLLTKIRVRIQANRGDPFAQFLVGAMYKENNQEHKAFEWFQKAANKGQPDALCSLGFLYSEGRIVPTDRCLSYMYFTLAIIQGCEEAGAFRTTLEREMTPEELDKVQPAAFEYEKLIKTVRETPELMPKDVQESIDALIKNHR